MHFCVLVIAQTFVSTYIYNTVHLSIFVNFLLRTVQKVCLIEICKLLITMIVILQQWKLVWMVELFVIRISTYCALHNLLWLFKAKDSCDVTCAAEKVNKSNKEKFDVYVCSQFTIYFLCISSRIPTLRIFLFSLTVQKKLTRQHLLLFSI